MGYQTHILAKSVVINTSGIWSLKDLRIGSEGPSVISLQMRHSSDALLTPEPIPHLIHFDGTRRRQLVTLMEDEVVGSIPTLAT